MAGVTVADTSTAFGERLKQAREDAGLGVRAAARAAGFSEGQWRQMEKGYRQVTADVRVPTNPKVETVRAAAKAVGLDVAEALDLAGHTAAAAAERARSVGPVPQDPDFVPGTDPADEPDDRPVSTRELFEEMKRVREALERIDRKLPDGP